MAHATTLLLRGNHHQVAKWKQLLFHRQQARGGNTIVIRKKNMHAGPVGQGNSEQAPCAFRPQGGVIINSRDWPDNVLGRCW